MDITLHCVLFYTRAWKRTSRVWDQNDNRAQFSALATWRRLLLFFFIIFKKDSKSRAVLL